MYLNHLYMLIFYLFWRLFVTCDMTNYEECGATQKSYFTKSQIVGGTKPKYMQYPWMAAVLLNEGFSWTQHCGATLINSNFVITAAHCFFGENTRRIMDDNYKVILGMNNMNDNEQYRQDQCVTRTIIHGQYDFNTNVNDIGLMQLCSPINFQRTNVRPICLPGRFDNNNLYRGLALVAGWGSTYKNGAPLGELVVVGLPLAKYSLCTKELAKENVNPFLYKTTLCTYSRSSGRDSCDGDSGGPLMGINSQDGLMYLRGIVSFGSTNCGGFGVYTKVSYFMDWINNNMYNVKTRNKRYKRNPSYAYRTSKKKFW